MKREEKIQKLIAIKELQVACTATFKLAPPGCRIEKEIDTEKGLTFSGFAPTVRITFYRMGYRAYINDCLKLSESWRDAHDEVIEMLLRVDAYIRSEKKRHTKIFQGGSLKFCDGISEKVYRSYSAAQVLTII
jgi:hypothetical protein